MQAILVMFRSDGERRSFSVTRDMTVVGRREDCDLRIPLGEISRKHCRLVRDGDTLRLEDLGSSNGTYWNGQRVQEAVLNPGDSIQIGPVVFVVQIDGVPADEEMHPVAAEVVAPPAYGEEMGAMSPTSQDEVADMITERPAGSNSSDDLGFEPLPAAHEDMGLEPLPAAHEDMGLEPLEPLEGSMGLEPMPGHHDAGELEPLTLEDEDIGFAPTPAHQAASEADVKRPVPPPLPQVKGGGPPPLPSGEENTGHSAHEHDDLGLEPLPPLGDEEGELQMLPEDEPLDFDIKEDPHKHPHS